MNKSFIDKATCIWQNKVVNRFVIGLNVVAAAALGLVCGGCADEASRAVPKPGEPVRFAASSADSRTFYDEDNMDADAKSVSLFWGHGDRVMIVSPQCQASEGLHGVYAVGVETDGSSGEPVKNQPYASTFDAVDGRELLWAENPQADFFAIYPERPVHALRPTEDGGATAELHIRPVQTVEFAKTGNTWRGTPFEEDASGRRCHNPDAIMYAQRHGSTAMASVPLSFEPFSTVMRIELTGYELSHATSDDYPGLMISALTLEAPEGVAIAGDFVADFNPTAVGAPSVSVGTNTSNRVTIRCSSAEGPYVRIGSDDKMVFNVFVIPRDGLLVKNDWRVTAETSAATYSHTLDTDATGLSVSATKIHRMRFPKMTVNPEALPPLSNWMKYIPDSTPLTWLSVPGAWRSYDANYQGTTDAKALWNAGVRAFHLDTRLTVSNLNHWDYNTMEYVCTDTESFNVSSRLETCIRVMDKLKEIETCITDEQFAVCILTIAEQAWRRNNAAVDMGLADDNILEFLIDKITKENLPKLYDKPIGSNVTVKDLRGKLLVICCAKNDYFYDMGIPIAELPMFYANMKSGTSNNSMMYFGQTPSKDLYVHYHMLENTWKTASPTEGKFTINNRVSAITNLLDKSKSWFEKHETNILLICGIGGSYNYSNVSSPSQLVANGSNFYSAFNKVDDAPYGVVLMNFCNESPSLDLTKRIITLNNKLLNH